MFIVKKIFIFVKRTREISLKIPPLYKFDRSKKFDERKCRYLYFKTLLQLVLISYHDRFVRLLYTQLYMYRYMSPRYFGKRHWRHRYQSWWYTRPSLKTKTMNVYTSLLSKTKNESPVVMETVSLTMIP